MVAVGGLAFGAIRGQDRQWEDPIAWISLAVGVVALIAFPILMAKRPNPLVPLGLFKRRRFATINLSTLLIYGALYTIFAFQGLFLQNVVGYSATAAGVIGLPTGILLTVLSPRIGTLAGRIGARPFLVVGPVMMALGLLWLARVPADTDAWQLGPGDPSTWLPPAGVLIDILPSIVLFGVGISLVVAPLTTTLMGSVPVSNAGPRLGDQQRDQPDRAAAAVGRDLRRRVGRVLRDARGGGPRLRRVRPGVAGPGAAAEPAERRPRPRSSSTRPGSPRSTRSISRPRVCAALLAGGAVANWIGLRPAKGEKDDAAETRGDVPGRGRRRRGGLTMAEGRGPRDWDGGDLRPDRGPDDPLGHLRPGPAAAAGRGDGAGRRLRLRAGHGTAPGAAAARAGRRASTGRPR